MIYVITALAPETRPVVEYLSLKREDAHGRFEIYRSDETLLIRSGAGKILSAAATAYLCGLRQPEPTDLIAQIGIGGTSDAKDIPGQLFLINKITDAATGKDYYPDLITAHSFKEKPLITYERPVQKHESPDGHSLVDMEAAGFYPSAQIFFEPHRISCFKIVSDYLDPQGVTPDKVSRWVAEALPAFFDYLNRSQLIAGEAGPALNARETDILKSLCRQLHFTKTQYHCLHAAVLKYKQKYETAEHLLKNFLGLTAANKTESKKRLDGIIRKLEV